MRLLFLLLLLLGLTRFDQGANSSFKDLHYHFHLSSAPEALKLSRSLPAVEQQVVFDIQDNDIKSKYNVAKFAMPSLSTFKSYLNTKIVLGHFSKEIALSKSKCSSVLRI